MSKELMQSVAMVMVIACISTGCTALPPTPGFNHLPTQQDVTLSSESGQTRLLTVTVPYDSDCSQFPRYTKSYIQNFQGGYILEWNTQVDLLAQKSTDAAKRKLYQGRALRAPFSEPVDTRSLGLLESNCMNGALSAQSSGRTQAHNDLIANPLVP